VLSNFVINLIFVISGHKKVTQYANTSLVVIQEENKATNYKCTT